MPLRALILVALLAGLAGGCGACGDEPEPTPPPAEGAAPATQPLRLVVLLVIDQLPSWTFQRDLPHLTGGLARLARDGVYYPSAELPYANTFTAPGHAVIGTGAAPAVNGILSNTWYRRERGQRLSAVSDEDSPTFFVVGSPLDPDGTARPNEGISGAQLRVEGIADVLRRHRGGQARSVAIALKDRGAVLVAGRRPDLAIWYEPEQPAMTTSRYYHDGVPPWLRRLAEEHPVSHRFDYVWEPLQPERLAELTGVNDDESGEGAEYDLGVTFPHAVARTRNPARALRATPAGDELVLHTALAALDGMALGQDDTADLLALSLSAHDYAGHYWGQESWERLDLLMRLDRALADFLAELDRRVGAGRYAVLVTSDHGAVRLVEHATRDGRAAHRVLTRQVIEVTNRAAREVLGGGDWVADISASTIYLSERFHRQSRRKRERALEAMLRALGAIEGMAFAARTEDLTGDCDRREGLVALACRSLIPRESGEIFLATKPDSFLTDNYQTGTSHGTPNPDDRMVPILLYAPGVPARVVTEPVSILQVAPTVTELLGVPAPEAAVAPSLLAPHD